jgi:hypothetical protein
VLRLLHSRPKQKLSQALHHRVSSYALAASATGVSMLALALPSPAEIVYTPAKGMVTRNVPFNIDLNGDGVVDFTILDHAKGSSFRSTQFLDVLMPHQGNAAMCNWVACSSGFSFAAALLAGVKIGNSYYAWMSSRALMAWEESSQGQSFSSGSWAHRSVHPPATWAYVFSSPEKLTLDGRGSVFNFGRTRRDHGKSMLPGTLMKPFPTSQSLPAKQ